MYYVYVLKSQKEHVYIGYTSDLKRRMSEHEGKLSPYTKNDEWHLVYYEAYLSKSDAQKREKRLKDGRARRQMLERISNSLITGDFK